MSLRNVDLSLKVVTWTFFFFNSNRSPSPEVEEEEQEQFEQCFLCNKLIPRSQYQAHVNEEIDRQNSQLDDSGEGAAAASGEMLTGLVRPFWR